MLFEVETFGNRVRYLKSRLCEDVSEWFYGAASRSLLIASESENPAFQVEVEVSEAFVSSALLVTVGLVLHRRDYFDGVHTTIDFDEDAAGAITSSRSVKMAIAVGRCVTICSSVQCLKYVAQRRMRTDDRREKNEESFLKNNRSHQSGCAFPNYTSCKGEKGIASQVILNPQEVDDTRTKKLSSTGLNSYIKKIPSIGLNLSNDKSVVNI